MLGCSLALLSASASVALAQTTAPLAVPKFGIAASPIGLYDDVRPRQYVGIVGRKAAWLGTETGPAELWVHPIKLVNDFQIPTT